MTEILLVLFVLIALEMSLWMRLSKFFNKNKIIFTKEIRKGVLCEILFHLARLIVLFCAVHWGLSLFQL